MSMMGSNLKIMTIAFSCLAIVFAACAPLGAQANSYQILHKFQGGDDGAHPGGSLVRDPSGSFYGVTAIGGSGPCGGGCGTIFSMTQDGTTNVLYYFQGDDGAIPIGLVEGASGILFGATSSGGTRSDQGTVFAFANGSLTVLYSFTGGADGATPTGRPYLDKSGNLYGTTLAGGDRSDGSVGYGVVYKISRKGKFSVVHAFGIPGSGDGQYPAAIPIKDAAGNLYVSAQEGGAHNDGAILKVSPTGDSSLFFSFSGSDGKSPSGPLLIDNSGNLIGTTALGGANGHGSIFELSPAGMENLLYSFTGGEDGANPVGVAMDKKGNLYGVTVKLPQGNGTVFSLSVQGGFSTLHAFAGGVDDGSDPSGAPTLGTNGNLLGTTVYGGSIKCGGKCGVIYEVGK